MYFLAQSPQTSGIERIMDIKKVQYVDNVRKIQRLYKTKNGS